MFCCCNFVDSSSPTPNLSRKRNLSLQYTIPKLDLFKITHIFIAPSIFCKTLQEAISNKRRIVRRYRWKWKLHNYFHFHPTSWTLLAEDVIQQLLEQCRLCHIASHKIIFHYYPRKRETERHWMGRDMTTTTIVVLVLVVIFLFLFSLCEWVSNCWMKKKETFPLVPCCSWSQRLDLLPSFLQSKSNPLSLHATVTCIRIMKSLQLTTSIIHSSSSSNPTTKPTNLSVREWVSLEERKISTRIQRNWGGLWL